MELVRLAYYPFRPEVPEAVREAGVTLEEVLASAAHVAARKRALERVQGAMGDGFGRARVLDERSALHELLSVAVSRMVCVALADRQLSRRYAAAEAHHLASVLALQPDDVQDTASVLGLELRPADDAMRPWRLDVPAYLRTAPVGDAHWKLMLRPVAGGDVRLTKEDAIGLCRHALQARIEQQLEDEAKRPLPAAMQKALDPLVQAVLPELEAAREKWSTGDFGPVQPGLFPPCIKDLFGLMQDGKNIPHHGRFAFASFMGTIGMNAEQIMDYLSGTPNFDREKSRYQIEHITGERGVEAYTPPGCQSMQTNGICPLDRRDGLCMKIKHPLSYYRAKIRFQEEDKKEADAKLEQQRKQRAQQAEEATA